MNAYNYKNMNKQTVKNQLCVIIKQNKFNYLKKKNNNK